MNGIAFAGGGAFGYAQALTMLGANSADQIDIFAGTSAGSFAALALASGIPALRLVAFYKNEVPRIFAGTGWRTRLRALLNPTFDDAPLNDALKRFFDGRTTLDLKKPCVIPVHDAMIGRPRIIWTDDGLVPNDLWEIARRSAAAHGFFLSHAGSLDGGAFHNCPSFALFKTVLRKLGPKAAASLKIFALGTGANNVFRTPAQTQPFWKTGILPIFITDTVDGASVDERREDTDLILRTLGGRFESFEFPHSDLEFYDPAVIPFIEKNWSTHTADAARRIDAFFYQEQK